DPRAAAVDVAVARTHACLVTRAGRVRCWGDNRHGELGDGTTDERTGPVAALGLDDAVSLALGPEASCAVRRGGAVACWGRHPTWKGDRLAPAPLAELHGVVGLGLSESRFVAALDDGSVVTNRGVLEGFRARVVAVRAGPLHGCAIDDDGAVRC